MPQILSTSLVGISSIMRIVGFRKNGNILVAISSRPKIWIPTKFGVCTTCSFLFIYYPKLSNHICIPRISPRSFYLPMDIPFLNIFHFLLEVTKHFRKSLKSFCKSKTYPPVGGYGTYGLGVGRVGAYGDLISMKPITLVELYGLNHAVSASVSPRSAKPRVSIVHVHAKLKGCLQ